MDYFDDVFTTFLGLDSGNCVVCQWRDKDHSDHFKFRIRLKLNSLTNHKFLWLSNKGYLTSAITGQEKHIQNVGKKILFLTPSKQFFLHQDVLYIM